MQKLDPLNIPLQGQQLIEASAGTGKTFTIGLLYLRLLLQEKLTVHEILVVTFTNSATDELRSRIRKRIREALDFYENRSVTKPDELLCKLLSQSETNKSINILKDAMTGMDDAAIFTIHSFCRRILQEHAFESNAPLQLDFLESEQSLRKEIIENFWRMTFYPSSPQKTAWATKKWSDPEGLLSSISIALSKIEAQCIPIIDKQQLQELEIKTTSAFKKALEMWPSSQVEVQAIFQGANCLSKNKKNGYSKDRIQTILEEINQLCFAEKMPWLLPETVHLLASSEMDKQLIGKRILPTHAFFTVFNDFFQLHCDFIEKFGFHVQQEALKFLLSEMDLYKQANSKIYFNDLLIKLHSTLNQKNSTELAQVISTRFPVALVDEFQDTDPLQYAIFKKIYSKNKKNGLLMIGDPKQAIYAFRGADIFTYIHARRDTAKTNRYTMDTNYRASNSMVHGVNTLFQTQSPFIYDQDIVFKPVKAGGAADETPATINKKPIHPFHCLFLPDIKYSKDNAALKSAKMSSYTIAKLLKHDKQHSTLIGTKQIQAADIAVLVRTHREAAIMQRALAELGITSVYYSQNSVYASDEAQQFCYLFRALVNIEDDAAVRRCLLTDFFGMNGLQIYKLQSEQQQWEELLLALMNYRTCWQNQGLMPMLQQLFSRQKTVARSLQGKDGERKLTNILHLAELLQEISKKHTGIDNLLHYLEEQIRKPDTESSAQQLRLESDENLVKIVTIHKAKGMEYPLVFLPFLWNGRTLTTKDTLSFHNPDTFAQIIDFGTGEKQNLQLAKKESLAEELRLLYVAVTRAQYSCYFCWGNISSMEKSAMAYLLDSLQDKNSDIEQTLKNTFNNNKDLLKIIHHSEEDDLVRLHQDKKIKHTSVNQFKGEIKNTWRVTSYSQLITSHFPEHHDKLTPAISKQQNTDQTNVATVFTFPKGATSGIFLHKILEIIDFNNQTYAELYELVKEQLEAHGFSQDWTKLVCQWIQQILTTLLDHNTGLCLQKITRKNRLDELGFHFSIQDLEISAFNEILKKHDIAPVQSQLVSMQGLMKGFIDLVFRYQDKYYIADYKSNHLGNDINDYCPDQLTNAMAEHRYDMQYLIYTVALHRYLTMRVPDYKYSTHFGGAYYLFLRGLDQEKAPKNGIFKIKPPWNLIKDLDTYFHKREDY